MNIYFYALAFIKDYFQCRIITHFCSVETVSAGQSRRDSLKTLFSVIKEHLPNAMHHAGSCLLDQVTVGLGFDLNINMVIMSTGTE